MLAISTDLLIGYGRLLALGQVAFFAVGAYVGAILTTTYAWPPALAFFIAAGAALLLALVLSPILWVDGFYFALATFAVVVLVETLATSWVSVTGGVSGLLGIPAFSIGGLQFSSTRSYFYLAWVPCLLLILVLRQMRLSRFGRALLFSRDEDIAVSLGIPVRRVRLKLWLFAAVVAGGAGDLYMHYLQYISPGQFGLNLAILTVAMAVIGGLATAYGAAIGAVLLQLVANHVPFVAEQSTLIYGLVVILLVILAPGGLYGEVQKILRRYVADADEDASQQPAEVG